MDLTEIPTDEGELYLAAVEDLASRRVPSFDLGEHHDAKLAAGALKMAMAIRGGVVKGVIFHSDRGSEPGFKGSSQGCRVMPIVEARPGFRQESSIRASCGVGHGQRSDGELFSTLEFELLRKKRFATKAEARGSSGPLQLHRPLRPCPASQLHLSDEGTVEYEGILAARAAEEISEAEAA